MRTIPIKLLLLLTLVSSAAFPQRTQNSEFSLIFGMTRPVNQSFSASNVTVSTPGSFFLQHAFAHQLLSVGPGDLYFELPTTLLFSETGSTSAGARIPGGHAFLITPGVRYKIPLWSRLSIYGVLGGGGGSFSGYELRPTTSNPDAITNRLTGSLTADFGGGVDFRLSQWLSVRTEVRDYVSRAGLLGIEGRNHVVFGFGIALHH